MFIKHCYRPCCWFCCCAKIISTSDSRQPFVCLSGHWTNKQLCGLFSTQRIRSDDLIRLDIYFVDTKLGNYTSRSTGGDASWLTRLFSRINYSIIVDVVIFFKSCCLHKFRRGWFFKTHIRLLSRLQQSDLMSATVLHLTLCSALVKEPKMFLFCQRSVLVRMCGCAPHLGGDGWSSPGSPSACREPELLTEPVELKSRKNVGVRFWNWELMPGTGSG